MIQSGKQDGMPNPYAESPPIAFAQPIDPNYDAVVLPMGSGAPGEFGALVGRKKLVIKQRFDLREAVADQIGCGCVNFENKYDIFDLYTGEALVHVKEESSALQRCCFKPNHSAKLNFFDVRMGIPENSLMMVGKKPFKCCCCTCLNICNREMMGHNSKDELFSHTKQPFLGGVFSPTVETMDRQGSVFATTKGPFCCVGGLVELCHTIEFDIYAGNQTDRPPIGKISKMKPDGMKGALKEAASDTDVFILDVPENFTPEQIGSLLTTVLLLDFQFFEDGAPCRFNPIEQVSLLLLARLIF